MLHSYAATNFQSFLDRVEVDLIVNQRAPNTDWITTCATGQRISKIVNSMKFVEDRIKAVILTWGRDELTKVVVEIKKEETDPDKALLHGPQLPGQGVSQADVDRMLGQDAIDKLFG